ncbi:hypothetical protein G9464_02900 [Halostella sp. JP-L12]|uniref:hypothetical protein n=1 Tax=Halostella TaxID=1843185 RepID=UPI0013CE9A11|nr:MULTISPECIES: hypothetical protein [Halostella]NHN46546.1 hypothetical protein [Halostella sp. JP-L12]
MMGVSEALQQLAAVCAGIEKSSSETDFTTATLLENVDEDTETGAVSMEMDVEIPFLENSDIDTEKAVSIEDARVKDNGALRIQFQARAFPENGEKDTISRSKSPSGVDHGSNNDIGHEEGQQKQEAQNPDQSPTEAVSQARRHSEPPDTDDLPPYRDPDRLQEVYELYSSFAEMTDALDVDVTPQTVRRYMIKYDIHEPSSNTASSSINALLNADPDSIPVGNTDQGPDAENESDEESISEVSSTNESASD